MCVWSLRGKGCLRMGPPRHPLSLHLTRTYSYSSFSFYGHNRWHSSEAYKPSLADHKRPRNHHSHRIVFCKLFSSAFIFIFVQKVTLEPLHFVDKRISWNANVQVYFSVTFSSLGRGVLALELSLDSSPLMTSSVYLAKCYLMLKLSLTITHRCVL